MTPRRTVFLSAVSSEFRAAVASDLRAQNFGVKVQEDFQLGSDTTLRKLHDYIQSCDLVITLIGTRAGAKPPPAAIAPFANMFPRGRPRSPEGETAGSAVLPLPAFREGAGGRVPLPVMSFGIQNVHPHPAKSPCNGPASKLGIIS